MRFFCEGFATKKGKAEALTKWFDNTNRISYERYKKEFGEEANIVDYDVARRLNANGRISALENHL
jgi:hypothetical protein